MTPEEAYNIAKEAGPSDTTRKVVCQNLRLALCYALDIDKCPRDDTREAVCKTPVLAYNYAYYVDKCPRDDTRKLVCEDPWWAFCYATNVDKCYREDTYTSAHRFQISLDNYNFWLQKFNLKKS